MKIRSLNVELIRADSAVAQFQIAVVFDGAVAGCEAYGWVVGPQCSGITTVEIAYPLVPVDASESTATLRGIIPEPNLWTPETPFVYAVRVEVRVDGRQTDTRGCVLALRGR